MTKQIELNINSIGGMGDGIAEHEGKVVFVPMTCPGDKVRAGIQQIAKEHIKANLVEVINPSKNRQTPPCKHFGKCGGCSLQHLNKSTYNNFKQDVLTQIIRGIGESESVISPMIEVGENSRRRAEFKIFVNKGEVNIGFFSAKTHDVIALDECPVSENKLVEILSPLKECLKTLKKPGNLKAVNATVLDKGVDAVVITKSELSKNDRQQLIAFAKENGIVRLSEYVQSGEASHISASQNKIECIYGDEDAKISFGEVEVSLPIGAFLQATFSGQQAITEIVIEVLKGCERVADLYSGCGTYSFPLVRQAKLVGAYEGSEDMVSAMYNSIIRNNLEARMNVSSRDLFNRPLKSYELNRFDGVVINPPRNGALPQIKNIRKSDIRKVVMVSCNPATFKRDAKCLIDGGYRINSATAIDQFYWSGHLEIVAVFEK